jgi:molybdate transport system ATP-binding protein
MSVVADFTATRGEFTLAFTARLEAGSVVAVLGPNGSGKTTLLRALAGLQPLATGSLAINDRIVDDTLEFVPPKDRSVGVVFQDYALFPHLTVLENVAFGPRSAGASRTRARSTATVALERLGVGDLVGRRPGGISGGQAQRVALARALVTDPSLLLLDEPLAALDVETRDSIRAELDTHLSSFDGVVVLVTHDPLDAMLLADRVIVLEGGSIVQDAAPAELARRPMTPYVASLMGVTLVRGTADDGVLALDDGGQLRAANRTVRGRALAVIRPEAVTIHRTHPEGSARNVWRGTITALQPSHDRVRVIVDGQPPAIAAVTPSAVAELALAKGVEVWLSLKAVDVDVYSTPAH